MTDDRAAEREYVLRSARDNDVKFIRLWFTDILGHLKGFAINVDDLEDAIEGGVGFDGSAIEGFARIDESDMRAFPDPTTFAILPWRPRQNSVARMFCDISTPDGKPFIGDPRNALKRNLERLAKLGYTYYVGPELEFFYLKDAQNPVPLDNFGYYDQQSSQPAADLRRDTVLNLSEMGIPVKYSHHEGAHSQHEIDLQYSDALTMADNVMTAKLVIKELAQLRDAYASFMPKPFSGKNGSGMHTHQSLFRGDQNAFYDAEDEYHLSITAKRFIAGLLRHAPEITLVTNQWVNSYKRLVPGYEAPVYVSWAYVNRSDLVRVPAYKPGYEGSVRIEYRAPDPACNPYLAFSVMLAAGLKGIEEEYPLPPAVEGNVFGMANEERVAKDIKILPGSLGEALALAEDSSLLREALGEHIFSSFIRNKKIEWGQYRATVTDYEISHYLPVL
ncbi:MAG: glutamine synthetase family protein [Chloroflexi bacterium]|nr:glutamine synthetase family protein [Chloroflexota bacterium]MDA1218432.1 glutamine synthetase family protein [Chloroflexota bacterium]